VYLNFGFRPFAAIRPRVRNREPATPGHLPSSISISATPPHNYDAGQPSAEQRDGCRLGYRGPDLSHDNLAVTNAKIGHQDLVYAGIKRAAATTWPKIATITGTRGAPAAAVAATATATATPHSRTAAATATEAAVGSA
jgi:hypothetical protein